MENTLKFRLHCSLSPFPKGAPRLSPSSFTGEGRRTNWRKYTWRGGVLWMESGAC